MTEKKKKEKKKKDWSWSILVVGYEWIHKIHIESLIKLQGNIQKITAVESVQVGCRGGRFNAGVGTIQKCVGL